MAKRINESVLWNKNSDHFWKGGWQLYASFSQSFFLQFLKSQCPFGSKYPEFSKTPPTFAFWMSLRVVMAIFPRNDIFFGTLCRISRQFETKRKCRSNFYTFFLICLYCLLSDLQEFKLMCKNLSQEQVRGFRTWRMYSYLSMDSQLHLF